MLTQLGPYLEGVESVVFLAGQRYREFLEPSLRSRGLVACIPMEGVEDRRAAEVVDQDASWLIGSATHSVSIGYSTVLQIGSVAPNS